MMSDAALDVFYEMLEPERGAAFLASVEASGRRFVHLRVAASLARAE